MPPWPTTAPRGHGLGHRGRHRGRRPGAHLRLLPAGQPGLLRKVGGDGSGGSSLTRRIVELHGGHVWLPASYRGYGSTFGFTVPGPARSLLRRATRVLGTTRMPRARTAVLWPSSSRTTRARPPSCCRCTSVPPACAPWWCPSGSERAPQAVRDEATRRSSSSTSILPRDGRVGRPPRDRERTPRRRRRRSSWSRSCPTAAEGWPSVRRTTSSSPSARDELVDALRESWWPLPTEEVGAAGALRSSTTTPAHWSSPVLPSTRPGGPSPLTCTRAEAIKVFAGGASLRRARRPAHAGHGRVRGHRPVLRSDPRAPPLPIVVLTSKTLTPAERRTPRGADRVRHVEERGGPRRPGSARGSRCRGGTAEVGRAPCRGQRRAPGGRQREETSSSRATSLSSRASPWLVATSGEEAVDRPGGPCRTSSSWTSSSLASTVTPPWCGCGTDSGRPGTSPAHGPHAPSAMQADRDRAPEAGFRRIPREADQCAPVPGPGAPALDLRTEQP